MHGFPRCSEENIPQGRRYSAFRAAYRPPLAPPLYPILRPICRLSPRFFVYRLRRYVPTWAGSISGCASALATVTGTARRAVSLPKHLRFRDVAQQAARLSPSLITVAASHRGRRFRAVVEGAVSPHRHVSARPDDSHHAGTPASSSATGRCDSRYRRPKSAASSNAGAAVNTP